MNITDLITQLIKIRAEQGDLFVEKYIPNCCYGDYQEDPDLIVSDDERTLYL